MCVFQLSYLDRPVLGLDGLHGLLEHEYAAVVLVPVHPERLAGSLQELRRAVRLTGLAEERGRTPSKLGHHAQVTLKYTVISKIGIICGV